MNIGKIIAISGPVVDVCFEHGEKLPKIREALSVTVDGAERVMEVMQHVGKNTVRCIMLAESDNLDAGDAGKSQWRREFVFLLVNARWAACLTFWAIP